jgi:protein-arginine deiminase
MKKIVIIITFSIVVTLSLLSETIKEISAQEGYQMLEQPSTYLVDVRSIAEYVFVGHPEMAFNIPLLFWSEMEQKLTTNKNFIRDIKSRFEEKDVLIFICRSGGRSLGAATLASRAGFLNVSSIKEGFEGEVDEKGYRTVDGWKNRNLPYTYQLKKELVYHPQKSASEIKVQIAADVNRDGKVEFGADNQGKNRWTLKSGAIFFNNNDSDQNTKKPDYADAVVNGPKDLRDLAVLRVKKIPDLPEDSRIVISVDDASLGRVRLFLKAVDNDYKPLNPKADGNIDPAQLGRADLELRIESNSYADKSWNGETEVTLTVISPNGETKSDSVRIKVAPFILLSNLNAGITLYAREFPGRNEAFIKSLSELVPQARAELVVVPAGEPYPQYSVWLQDTLEIGYSEIPGQKMNVVLKANRGRSLDNYAKDGLLGPDFGWIQVGTFRKKYGRGRGGNEWLDWYGNLETTPPLPKHPHGRIYYGYNPDGPEEASLNPEIVSMLDAQEIQGPALKLDTGWLLIKHVDEVISFLPSGNPEQPYKVLVVDTEAMIALLEKWMEEGIGEVPMLDLYSKKAKVSSLAKNKDMIDLNHSLQKNRIEPNIDLLKKELGLREEDFIRVPSLFDKNGVSVVPNMVNSTVLNGHIFIVAPNGPVIDGRDLLEEEMRQLLSGLPLMPHFIDARQYHKWGGEVHCATNVRRKGFRTPWWEMK